MRLTLVCFAFVAAIGCGEESPTAAPEVATHESAAAVHDSPTEVEMVAAMEQHYDVVILAHDGLLQGDLETFRSQLARVQDQELPPTAPQQWLPFHEALQSAASEGATAADLDAASSTLAKVVLACGTCHAALDAGPVYPAPAPEDGDGSVETAMLDHKWVTERMWEGVTGPWDNAWERGADSLAMLQIFGDAMPNVVLTDELWRRERELREIGEEAKTATTLDERAALYGRLLATCGECHQLIGLTFEDLM